jgi:hypothetical protein
MTAPDANDWVESPIADPHIKRLPRWLAERLAPMAPDCVLVWRLGACVLADNLAGRDKVLVESGLGARGCRLLVAAAGELAKAVLSSAGDDRAAAEVFLTGLIDRQLTINGRV